MALDTDAVLAPLVIAHRGACGYLPEHTLPAKALAYGMGADYLEQDVVATRDDQLIVLHDIHLDTVTDVAERFPDRARADGRWYARDFDLEEIRSLRAWERMNEYLQAAAFPNRFPHKRGRFEIPALEDEIEMIQGMNLASGRSVGIYPEIKKPAWHHAEGVDVAAIMLDMLDAYGYRDRTHAVYVQCFDAKETRRLRDDLGTDLRLIQLLADNSWEESDTDYSALQTDDGLADVAQYADGIGPWLMQLYEMDAAGQSPIPTRLGELAHEHGLAIHPYTFRADALAPGFTDYASLVRWMTEFVKIDGLFTDFPDLTLRVLGR